MLFINAESTRFQIAALAASERRNGLILFVKHEDEDEAQAFCRTNRHATYCEGYDRDHVSIARPYPMVCHVCGEEYLETKQRVDAWANSGQGFNPTDWECPACRAAMPF